MRNTWIVNIIRFIIYNDHFRGFVTKNDKIFEKFFWMEDYEAGTGLFDHGGSKQRKEKV